MMTLQQGADFAGGLKKVSTDYYYYEDGRVYWKKIVISTTTDVILVEVWVDAKNQAHYHRSRNPFHWIDDRRQKEVWHALVTEKRGSAKFPKWADVDSLIGYTSSGLIDFDVATGAPKGRQLVKFAAQVYNRPIAAKDMEKVPGERSEWLPSVYYKFGRRTLDHREASNITWKDRQYDRYLFFGNVRYANYKTLKNVLKIT